MSDSKTFRNICGIVLSCLLLISALLAILGIWDLVEGEIVWRLIFTFVVVGGTTVGLSYTVDTFFGKIASEPCNDKDK